jgi:cytochrome c oxidase subunit 2
MSAALWPGLPTDVSMHGHRISALLHSTHLLVGGLALVAVIALVLAVLRHHRNRRPQATYVTGEGARSFLVAFGLSALVFGVVDNNLAIRSFDDVDELFWNFRLPQRDPDTVRIEVNAHQWAWEARYEGIDRLFQTADDIVTWNEFKVPLGRKVMVQLTSTDVIHNFYLPNFLIKMDAVPGRVNRLWFEPKSLGRFEIACSQHCGVAHYKMRAELEVMAEGAFDSWVGERSDHARRGYDPADAAAHWGWTWHTD